jgi:hypothetical protein
MASREAAPLRLRTDTFTERAVGYSDQAKQIAETLKLPDGFPASRATRSFWDGPRPGQRRPDVA